MIWLVGSIDFFELFFFLLLFIAIRTGFLFFSIVPEMFTSTNIPLHLSLPSRAMGIFHILIKPYPLRLFRHGLCFSGAVLHAF